MIYFLKFGAAVLLPPGLFMLISFWLSVRIWRRGERGIAGALLATTLAFYALSTPLVSSSLMRNLEAAYSPPEKPEGDVIVCLSGGATLDTPDLGGSGGLSEGSSARLLAAARLYHHLHVPVLYTGGRVFKDSGPEAEIARRILLDLGVPEKDIILETESLTTGQNAKYSAEIIRARGFVKPLLVTSAFHMKRSVLNFAKHGIEVTPFPAGYRVNTKPRVFHYMWLSPQASALEDSVCVLREELRYLVTATTGF
ncbi:MAG: YdcF family protein [Oscillospiraceae bacterium]|nr:YdcF family protein [Oscillospiraceae bacterium]